MSTPSITESIALAVEAVRRYRRGQAVSYRHRAAAIVILHADSGLTFRDIADAFGVSVSTITYWRNRACALNSDLADPFARLES